MTCIVALEQKGNLYFGGDRYCGNSNNNSIDLCDQPKVYSVCGILIGIAGSVKCEQILEKCAKKLFKANGIDREWIQYKFTSALRKEMKKEGALIEAADGQELMPDDSAFLIGVNSQILVLQSDFSVWRSSNKLDALGAAALVAKGSLYSLRDVKMSPKKKVLKSLESAQHFHDWCRGPFDIISTED